MFGFLFYFSLSLYVSFPFISGGLRLPAANRVKKSLTRTEAQPAKSEPTDSTATENEQREEKKSDKQNTSTEKWYWWKKAGNNNNEESENQTTPVRKHHTTHIKRAT